MAINITAKGDPQKKLKWAFKMYDVDGNGEIDKNEMLSIIQVKEFAFNSYILTYINISSLKSSQSTI